MKPPGWLASLREGGREGGKGQDLCDLLWKYMGDRYECQNDGLDTLDAMETGGGGRESGREGVSQYALVEHAGRDGGGVGAEEILEGFFFLEGAAVADRAIAPIFVDSLDAFVVFGRDLREEWGEGGGGTFLFSKFKFKRRYGQLRVS